MAWIQKRASRDGLAWRVAWWVTTPGGGRKKHYSKAFPTEGQARNFRNRVERDELTGVTTDYRGGNQLFGDYAEAWLKARLVRGRPLAPTTLREYQGLLRRNVLPTFESAPLRAITGAKVRTWLAETVEQAGPDQAAKSYRVLRAIMATAAADELISRNPCQIRGAGAWEAAERPMVPTSVVLRLSDALVAVDDTKDKSGSSRLRAFALLAGFAGLRPGELLALRREDVDPLHQTVTVDENAPEVAGVRVLGPPKSEAGRRTVTIPATIMSDLLDHLQRFVGAEPEAWVFTGPRGGPMRQNYISVQWRKALALVPEAPPGLRVYDLRHHAATLTARVPGVTTKELMARIGHSSPRAALIYQHATAERDRRIADAIDSEIAAATVQSAQVLSFGLPVASQQTELNTQSQTW